jgi:serine protease
VRWELSRTSRVKVDVFDVQGRRVTSLLDRVRPAGPGEVHWTGRDTRGREVASGVYFVRVQAVGQAITRRVLRLR